MANLDFSDIDKMLDSILTTEENKTDDNITEVVPVIKDKEESKNNNKENISIIDSSNIDSLIKDAQDKIKQIGNEMNSLYMERGDLVDLSMIALIASTNLLMLGYPGTAKSQFTEEICSRITNGVYFQWMLNKTSDPSEILGPYSVKEMENDKFKRITTNKLPEANIAFLDEVYKCNSPVLNILLPIMNEHVFYNDGIKNQVPLLSLFGASNEPPEDDSLKALHDRFLIRINLEYVQDVVNQKNMLQNYLLKRASILNTSRTQITLDELKLLQDTAKTIRVPKTIITEFVKLINQLKMQNIIISDRRKNESLKILQSSAVYHGRKIVSLDDFKVLKYVLWEREEDIEIIEKFLSVVTNPNDDKINRIQKDFDKIKNDIDSITDTNAKVQKAIESKNTLVKLNQELNKIIMNYDSVGNDITEIEQLRLDIVNYQNDVIQKAIDNAFPSF